MRRSTFVGLAVLFGLGVCTSLVTSFSLGRIHPGKAVEAAQADEQRPRLVENVQVVPNDLNAAQAGLNNAVQPGPARVHPPHELAFSQLRRGGLQVALAGRTARVSVGATLFDRRPNLSYIWVLRVQDAQNNIALQNYYDNQVFQLVPGKDNEVTFDEAFGLDPGSYRVTVSLYRLFPGLFGPQDLKAAAGRQARNFMVLSANKEITVR